MGYHLLLIAVALFILFLGAEALVRGSASLAVRLGLSPLAVGLTIVAFGTSSPELFVSLQSAFAGQGDIAVGNVVGSNAFNIGVILGLTALICPIPVHVQVVKWDAPVALLVALLLPLLLIGGDLTRGEGGWLLVGLLVYVIINFKMLRTATPSASGGSIPVDPPHTFKHGYYDALLIIGGLLVLVVGSHMLVTQAIAVARAWGVSEAVIGLTIIAAGTSMPELATSITAAFRRQSDIAIGNVVGSNIFNILGILGCSSICAPLVAPGIAWIDYGAMVLFTVMLVPIVWTGYTIRRIEGAGLLVVYAAYLWILWPAAASA